MTDALKLSNPPIGKAAVVAFYTPIMLTTFAVVCGTRTFHITSHAKAAPNIKVFFQEANARGLAHLITSYDGCYVDRNKRLSNEKSMHGYGAAFDINAATNNQGDAHGNMPDALVALGKSLGFFWGGEFRGQYVDKMHFQLGVDFALDGRPEPRVTWKPDASGLVHPALTPAAPAAGHLAATLNGVKVYDARGTELFAQVGIKTTAEWLDGRLIVRLG